jgi:membrane-bound serine protease (ClpP class)
MAAALGLAVLFLARLVYQSRKLGRQAIGLSLVGAAGMVAAELAPRGVVQVGDETWTAVSEDDSVIPVGERVRVTRVDGLILTVSRRRDGDT